MVIQRVGVIGGSIGGLSAARELRKLGAAVRVFERSPHRLEERGAGIGMDPAVHSYLTQEGLIDQYLRFGRRVVLGSGDRHLWTQALNSFATSWDLLYEALRRAVPDECCHAGACMESFEPEADEVRVCFAGGRTETFDLLVCADGAGSYARQHLLPDVEARYAGYVIVRGLLHEAQLPREALQGVLPLYESGTLLHYAGPHTHAVAYFVPGRSDDPNCVRPGHRRLNWGWYVNIAAAELGAFLTDRAGGHRHLSVPPGQMPERRRADLVALARRTFPESFAAVIEATPAPFEQAIYSYSVPRTAFGRVCLLGDAAHLARPHAGSGAAMAVVDARALREALEANPGDVAAALDAWQRQRLPECARIVDLSVRLGTGHQVEAHDWERFTPADFDRWWAEMVQGGHLYFDRKEATGKGQDSP